MTRPAQRFPQAIRLNWEVAEWRHASAILQNDFPSEWTDLTLFLKTFRVQRNWLSTGGGNKSALASEVDQFFFSRGWREKQFKTEVVVDEHRTASPTHKIDCYKNKVALELEWNNKDPFYDRDLNNFRLLFELRAVSVGIIITRTDELQPIFNAMGRGSSYGNSTTHWSKLIPRLEGGSGGGCPVLALGIKPALIVDTPNE